MIRWAQRLDAWMLAKREVKIAIQQDEAAGLTYLAAQTVGLDEAGVPACVI